MSQHVIDLVAAALREVQQDQREREHAIENLRLRQNQQARQYGVKEVKPWA